MQHALSSNPNYGTNLPETTVYWTDRTFAPSVKGSKEIKIAGEELGKVRQVREIGATLITAGHEKNESPAPYPYNLAQSRRILHFWLALLYVCFVC